MRNLKLGGGLLALLLLFAANASADPVTAGGGWYAFCFGGAGSPAVATGCVDSTVGNTFTWSSPTPVILTITDGWQHGDTFNAFEGGLILSTPVVPADGLTTCGPGGGFGSDPNCAVIDPLYSHGSVLLSAGAHGVDIFVGVSPYGGGQGYMRVDPVPEPGTLLLLGSGLVGIWARRKKVI